MIKTKKVKLYDWLGENYQFNQYMLKEYGKGTNKEELINLVKVINEIIKNELTPRQRQCFLEYVINCKKLRQISKEIGIHNSVVSRHISAAKRRILKFLKYTKAVDKYVQTQANHSKEIR